VTVVESVPVPLALAALVDADTTGGILPMAPKLSP
jgi:hypothetical protein